MNVPFGAKRMAPAVCTAGLLVVALLGVACGSNGGSGDEFDAGNDIGDGAPPGPDGAEPGPDGGGTTPDAEGAADAATNPCAGNCYYVRADASGSEDGSDWDSAFTDLPASLERGHIYWVASGDYAGRTLDTEASGTELVEIYRATAEQHGTDTAWQASYAQGDAVFGPVEITSPYFTIDGGAARSMVVRAGYQGSALRIAADSVTVRNLDLDGAFATDSSGYHTEGACMGLSIRGDDVEVRGCDIHDAADDGVSATNSSNLTFVGNQIHALHGCGTDGGCGPCYNGHSDGIETYNLSHSLFAGNFIYDMVRVSAFYFGGWADELGGGPSEYCQDIALTNNILYSPDTGFVAYFQDVGGLRVYHNVIWGTRKGGYGGLAIGEHVTDLDLYNNVILSINYDHMGATYDAAEHRGDYNLFGVALGQYTEGAHDVIEPDPGFAVIPDMNGASIVSPSATDFAPATGSPCIDSGYAGDATIVLPTDDFFGNSRDANPDIGAIEASGG